MLLIIINRYTFRPQEKSIFAVLLEWPNDGSVILNEPVVTQEQTQVRLDYFCTEMPKICFRIFRNRALAFSLLTNRFIFQLQHFLLST